jgi:nucleolar MIF4G domain-containing protein 1
MKQNRGKYGKNNDTSLSSFDSSSYKDKDGHIDNMNRQLRKQNSKVSKRDAKKLKRIEKKRNKALTWTKRHSNQSANTDKLVQRVNNQIIKSMPKHLQKQVQLKRKQKRQSEKQLQINKKQKLEEEEEERKNDANYIEDDDQLILGGSDSEINSDDEDEDEDGESKSLSILMDYDSDESDIIDDIAPETENEQKQRTQRTNTEEGSTIDDDGVIHVDTEFKRIMDSRDKLDDRIIADLEKKLGIYKKKELERQEKQAEDNKTNTDGESELSKLVREKREQKKLQKQQQDGEEEEEDNNQDEVNEDMDDGNDDDDEEEVEADGRWNDGLDDLLDDLDEDEGDDFAEFKYNPYVNEEDEDDLHELLPDGDEDELDDGLDELEGVDEGDDFEDDMEQDSDIDEDEAPKPTATNNAPAAAVGKYIPPHLRNKMAVATSAVSSDSRENDARHAELKKQIRNILNKLSIENMENMTGTSLQLYQSNSKNDFRNVLAQTIIESVCDNVNLQSQFVLVYAAYIVVLHNVASSDIGATFLEKLIIKFDESKYQRQRATNLITMICHIYNLGLIYSNMIYDVVRVLLEDNEEISELSIELIYKILKVCGFQLRTDDPNALKNIVDLVQTKSEDSTVGGSRFKYLLEFISQVKNNRNKKEQESDYEKYKNVRKVIKSLQKKHDKSGENTLRISYNDLLEAETKGRWWIVGGAWVGRQADDKSLAPKVPSSSSIKFHDAHSAALAGISEKKISKLKQMARDQNLTTELRTIIFTIIMSAEDYLDAFQRLLQLNIKKNDREIARVIFHCCCKEKQFNLYYALLATEVAKVHRSTSLCFQYTFFEHFKQLNECPVRNIINLSHLLAHMIGHQALSLSVLKAVDFDHIKKQEVIFYRLFFMNLLLDYDEHTVNNQFLKLVRVRHCDALREGMQLFLMQFIKKQFRRSFVYDLLTVKDVTKKEDKVWMKQQEKQLRQRAKIAKKIVSMDPTDFDDIEDE